MRYFKEEQRRHRRSWAVTNETNFPITTLASRRWERAEEVTWSEVQPCYVFHPLNAYEDDDGRVVLDVVRHPKMFATDLLGPNEGAPTGGLQVRYPTDMCDRADLRACRPRTAR